MSPHFSEVEDEAVSLVEAAPGQLDLLGTDVAFPFDLVQPVHRPAALRPPEARLHATLLRAKLFFLCLKFVALLGNVTQSSVLTINTLWHRGQDILRTIKQ